MRECAAGLFIKAVNIILSQKAPRPQVMYTLIPLIVAALACALARPPVESNAPQPAAPGQNLENLPPPSREFLQRFIVPKFIVAKYEDSPRVPSTQEKGLIDQELSNMINELEEQQRAKGSHVPKYSSRVPSQIPRNYFMRYPGAPQSLEDIFDNYDISSLKLVLRNPNANKEQPDNQNKHIQVGDDRNPFALTPDQNGYYEDLTPADKTTTTEPASQRKHVPIEPREIRQNPNWSKNKAFVAENLDKLRAGFTIEDADGTTKPSHIHVLETSTVDSINSIYGVALMAAVGAALAMAITGFIVGWFTLSRKAKAAADVDYPAYGVTGPTIDSSGDRKLAQSAHMYHYQHQKQQIIAMERNGIDHPDGSVSDPDSEEDNDEGDYTVYECPGFATTGDMEVKNPLFKEDATPISPKSDTDKSQPKE